MSLISCFIWTWLISRSANSCWPRSLFTLILRTALVFLLHALPSPTTFFFIFPLLRSFYSIILSAHYVPGIVLSAVDRAELVIKISGLGMLSQRYLLNNSRQLDVELWSSGRRLGLEAFIWESCTYKWYLKPVHLMRAPREWAWKNELSGMHRLEAERRIRNIQ